MSNSLKIIYIIIGFAIIVLFALIVYVLSNFQSLWKCSTTTDIEWFLDNNCERYVKRTKQSKLYYVLKILSVEEV